jgi:hypothetical protein
VTWRWLGESGGIEMTDDQKLERLLTELRELAVRLATLEPA